MLWSIDDVGKKQIGPNVGIHDEKFIDMISKLSIVINLLMKTRT